MLIEDSEDRSTLLFQRHYWTIAHDRLPLETFILSSQAEVPESRQIT